MNDGLMVMKGDPSPVKMVGEASGMEGSKKGGEREKERTQRQVGDRGERVVRKVEGVVPALKRAKVLDRLDGETTEFELALLERVDAGRGARDELLRREGGMDRVSWASRQMGGWTDGRAK